MPGRRFKPSERVTDICHVSTRASSSPPRPQPLLGRLSLHSLHAPTCRRLAPPAGYNGPVTIVDRTPPQNLEAEQSVLGSVLLDNEVYAALEGMLTPEHFYKESHRKIFRAFERLFPPRRADGLGDPDRRAEANGRARDRRQRCPT